MSCKRPIDLRLTNGSGIFGYISYLVEKDRKFIIDTLVNGTPQLTAVKKSYPD